MDDARFADWKKTTQQRCGAYVSHMRYICEWEKVFFHYTRVRDDK